MCSSQGGGWRLVAILGLALAGCTPTESALTADLAPPANVTATPISMSVVRLDWTPGPVADLVRYRIERRVDFQGGFELLAEVDPTSRNYFDSGLLPETAYGYRILAVDREGERSRPSTVAGARTAPLPGLRVETVLGGGTDPGVADPNGYRVVVSGPRDTTFDIGTIDQSTIAPLPAGLYTIVLRDVLPTCTLQGDSVRHVTVVDTGLVTRAGTSFVASCLDASRGRITALIAVQGDSVDPDGYLVNYAGIVTGSPNPVLGGAGIPGSGGSAMLSALLPGDYEVTLEDVDSPCIPSGPTSVSFTVAPLSEDTVRFAVICPNKGGGNPDAPLVLRHHWNPQAASNGQTVTLEAAIDLSGLAGKSVGGIQANFHYDPSVLSFQSASAPFGSVFAPPTVNSSTIGVITWLSISAAASQPSGVLPTANFTFQVIGGSGATTMTRSQIELVVDLSGSEDLTALFRVAEDTFVVAGGGGGGGNQSPTANANGPYGVIVGTPISFSSAGSADADGTITAYSWDFGDGASSSAANPTHSYATPGTYSVALTVTDNQGGTGSDQATATVSPGSSIPFLWLSSFGALESTLGTYPLTLSLNLTQDISQTPGPEALGSYSVEALTWDPAVLQYHSLVYGSGGGAFNTTDAVGGCRCRLVFSGAPTTNTGVVPLATIRFTPVAGAPGRSTTTSTTLGPVLSTAGLGSFNYRSLIQVVEATVTVP